MHFSFKCFILRKNNWLAQDKTLSERGQVIVFTFLTKGKS